MGNPIQFGRVVYVEPNNDIDGTGRGTNFTFKPEDYSILVDLQVDVVDRFAYNGSGTRDSIEYTLEWDAKGTKTSMFKGTNGMLTTRAMDTSFNEIIDNYNQEAIGINSIEIRYNSWNYPEITIQFTDIRGATLLSSADYVHTSLAGNDNKAKYADNFANTFFSTFFRFPYPRYTLIVKGFYGRPVSYSLCVNDFKTKFNSSTGNFDVTVSFIGYMYGILTDIPMRLLFAAPHSEYLGKDYWDKNKNEDKRFVYADSSGTPMKRFTELSDEIKAIKDKLKELPEVKAATDEAKEVETRKAELSDIKSQYEAFKNQFKDTKKPNLAIKEKNMSELQPSDGSEIVGHKYLVIFSGGNAKGTCERCNGTGKLNNNIGGVVGTSITGGVMYMPPSANECPDCHGSGSVGNKALEEVEVAPTIRATLYKKIKNYNSKPENGSRAIVPAPRFDSDLPIRGSVIYKRTKGSDEVGPLKFDKDSDTFIDCQDDYAAICDYLEKECGDVVNSIKSECIGVCILRVDEFENSLNRQLATIDSELETAFDKVKEAENSVYEQLLGFKVNIKNIIDMCLAHLDTFMACMYNCMKEVKAQNRLFSDSNLSPVESDVKTTVTKDTDNNYKVYLPPFFAFRKENPKKKELEDAWIGDDHRFSDEDRFPEIKLINGFLNGMLKNEMDRKENAEKVINGKTAEEFGLVVGENYCPMFVNDYFQKINPYDGVVSETYEPLVAMFAFRCLLALVYCSDYPDVNTRFNSTSDNKVDYFKTLGEADAETFSKSKNFEAFKNSELQAGSFNELTWDDFRAYVLGSDNTKVVGGSKEHVFFAGDNNPLFKFVSGGVSGFMPSYGRGDKIAVPLNFNSPESAVDIVNRIVSDTKETNGFGVSRDVAMPIVTILDNDKEMVTDQPKIESLFADTGISKKGIDKIGFYFKSNDVWKRYVSGTSSKFWELSAGIKDVINKWNPDYWFPTVVRTGDFTGIGTANEYAADGHSYAGNIYEGDNIEDGVHVYGYEPVPEQSTVKAFFLGREGGWLNRLFGINKNVAIKNKNTGDSYIDKNVVPLIVDGNNEDFMLMGFSCGEGTLFEHEFFLQQNNNLAKAFLFLHSLPTAEISAIGEVVSSIMKKTYTPSITDIPFVSALFIGGLYWREANNGFINYDGYKPAQPRELITHGIDSEGDKITRPLNPIWLKSKDSNKKYISIYDPELEQTIKDLETRGSSTRYDKKLSNYLEGDKRKDALFCGFWDLDTTVKQRFIDLFTGWANSEFTYFLDEFTAGVTVQKVRDFRENIKEKIFTGTGLNCKAKKNGAGVTEGTRYNDYLKNTFGDKFFKNHCKLGASSKEISLITALRPHAEAVEKLSSLLSKGCTVKVAFPRALMTRDVFSSTGWTEEASSLIISESVLKAGWTAFHDGIMNYVGEKKEDDDSDAAVVKNVTPPSVTPEEKLSLYLTLKNIHDKWLIATEENKYRFSNNPDDDGDGKHKSISKHFYFINSYHEDVGTEINLNIEELPKQLDKILTDINGASSLYSFMYDVADQARMQLLALPIFNNMSDPKYVESIFTPMPYDDIDVSSLDSETEYVFMYPEEASKHLNLPSDGKSEEDRYKFEDDSFMFVTESGVENVGNMPNTFFNTKEKNIPVFGVTFAKQNQSIFKDINVSMDNPKTTEVAIYNTVAIADRFNAGNTQITALGQDLFPIYSNYSYECSVNMMGCACIMPLMYFQLNNIPMFKGSYIIYNVTHSITPGNMTTTFSGQRLSKYRKKRNENALAGFPNENALRSPQQILEDKVNELIEDCYTVSGHKLENEYVYNKISEKSGITDKAALRAVEYAETHYTGAFFPDGRLKVYHDPWMARSSGVTYQDLIVTSQYSTSYTVPNDYASNIKNVEKANEQLTIPSSTTIVGAFGLPSQLFATYGAASMQEFFDECAASFTNQGLYFGELLHSNSALKSALENKNWPEFARLYKGAGGITRSGVYMPGDNGLANYIQDLETGYNEASGASSVYIDRYEGPLGTYEPELAEDTSWDPATSPDTSITPYKNVSAANKCLNATTTYYKAQDGYVVDYTTKTNKSGQVVAQNGKKSATASVSRCAAYVKNAMKYGGGLPYVTCNGGACGQMLRTHGWQEIYTSKQGDPWSGSTIDAKWEKGDVMTIDDNPALSDVGHIAMWCGTCWVSDFKQNSCVCYTKSTVIGAAKKHWDAGGYHFFRYKNRTNT